MVPPRLLLGAFANSSNNKTLLLLYAIVEQKGTRLTAVMLNSQFPFWVSIALYRTLTYYGAISSSAALS